MDELTDVDNEPSDFGGYDEYEDNQHHDALYEKLTDFDPFLKQVIMEWLGMYYDSKEGQYMRDPDVTPTMNMKGARWCIMNLRTYTRDNNIMTRLGENSFKNIMQDACKTFIFNIGCRAEEFGIKNNGDIYAVFIQLIASTNLVLSGTFGNKAYVDTISGSYRFNEGGQPRRDNMQSPQRRGIIGGFKKLLGVR